jgi:hypothetical protein
MATATTTAPTAKRQPAAVAHHVVSEPPEGLWYRAKCRILGPPLITEQLTSERLPVPLALGVLSCDGLSSAA